MFAKLFKYVKDNEFKLTMSDNKIYIVNYKKIITLTDVYILILANKQILEIKGQKLLIKKIMDQELMISGLITNIGVKYE